MEATPSFLGGRLWGGGQLETPYPTQQLPDYTDDQPTRGNRALRQPNQKPTPLPKLFLILVGFSVALLALILLLADIKCNYDIENWWAQPYPGAETVGIKHDDWYRPRALFETVWMLRSEDDVEQVKQWYREKVLSVLDEERSRGLAYADHRVQEADGGGSLITLYSSCGI